MIRLTVLYNLPADSDVEAFLQWRLTEHQARNQLMPGVIHTSFSKVVQAWPEGGGPAFQFIATMDWENRDSFEAAFYAEEEQARLAENLKKLGDYQFLVSEILI